MGSLPLGPEVRRQTHSPDPEDNGVIILSGPVSLTEVDPIILSLTGPRDNGVIILWVL